MKKVFMLVMVAFMTLAMSQKAQAIEDPNPKGTTVIGIRGNFEPGYHYFGVGANVVADITIVDSWWKGHFTVGGYVGSNFYSHISHLTVMPRATYGLNITKDFEAHVGVMSGIGFRHWGSDYYYGVSNDWYFTHGEVLGCRYFFTPNIGVEAEVGYVYTMGYLNAGLTIKL